MWQCLFLQSCVYICELYDRMNLFPSIVGLFDMMAVADRGRCWKCSLLALYPLFPTTPTYVEQGVNQQAPKLLILLQQVSVDVHVYLFMKLKNKKK